MSKMYKMTVGTMKARKAANAWYLTRASAEVVRPEEVTGRRIV